jgi:LCP family protein required for cell wall assembly
MPAYTRYAAQEPTRRRRRWPAVLRSIGLVLVAAVCLSGGMAFGWLQKTVGQVESSHKVVVKNTKIYLTQTTSGAPVNILLIGSDRRLGIKGDKGRSDTMLLVRLDPQAGTISMLSVPRDLWVHIPGYGMERVNVAYTLGGPAKTVAMFKELTGLPINHFVDINFVGFINIVDYLGGVYIDVDRRYYNPPGTGWAAIDLQPGYQRLNGHQALGFVRFRHDATGDFNRMIRQQVFLHEVERQTKRWSNITKLPQIISAVAKNTISDMSSLGTLMSMGRTVLGLNTSRVYQSHIEAPSVMIGGKSVLQASAQDIQRAVDDFLDPKEAPVRAKADRLPKGGFTVRVLNGSGKSGLADTVAQELRQQGFNAVVAGNADRFTYTKSIVYAGKDLSGWAAQIAALVHPGGVHDVPRLPGTLPGVTVIVGSQFTGVPQPSPSPTSGVVQSQIIRNAPQDVARWRALAAGTRVKVLMPTVWSAGMRYDADPTSSYDGSNFRAYTIDTGSGHRAAVCVTGATASDGFWHIEETTWTDPPILSDPNDVRTVGGVDYMLFYQNDRLHRVAWKANGCLYWVTNTLRDELSNELLWALATSCKPVL